MAKVSAMYQPSLSIHRSDNNIKIKIDEDAQTLSTYFFALLLLPAVIDATVYDMRLFTVNVIHFHRVRTLFSFIPSF